MSKFSRGIVAAGALVVLAFGLSPAKADDPPPSPPSECSPDHTFSPDITNQLAPMAPGQVSIFFGIDEKVPLGLKIEVLNKIEYFYDDVPTRVVREIEWADKDADGTVDHNEKLIEVSDNYFAQTGGTVCYFGEDVKIFAKNGKFKGDTTGSWRADASGNAPGVFMPASPAVDVTYQMEYAPGIAMDVATPRDLDVDVTVPAGAFEGVMQVEDCNPLEGPDSCGIKYYAPGTGLIIDGPVELTAFTDPTP